MGLIDADTLKKDLESVTLSNGTLLNTNTVLLLLDKYPIAYDVDKVVKELEAEQQKYKAQALETDDIDTVSRCAINEVAMQTAIDIVKRGGNIELSKHSKSQGNRTGKQKTIIEAESKAE